MKKVLKVISSLTAAVSIVCSLLVVMPAEDVKAAAAKLVDLDLSTYVEDTSTEPNNTTASIGNVTNNGTLASSTRVVMSSLTRYHKNELKLAQMWNANGEKTYWFDYTNDNNNVADKNRFRMINEPALESQANTISVWIKYDPSANSSSNRLRTILDYSVNGTQKFTLRTDTSTNGNFILTDGYSYNWRSVQSQANNTWVNLVVTNPAYVDGSKVMKTYLNGTLLGSTTVTRTENVTDAIIAIAGTNPENSNGLYYPISMSFGEFEVYSGELSQSEIADLYSNNAYKFVEGEEPLPGITGYTFSGDTFAYDGSSHMINVVAGANATHGVSVSYSVNGLPFSGAAAPGTYNVTATITKAGYTTLVLSAPMVIMPGEDIDNEVLIDLDFSTYVKDISATDPDNVSGSIGNVTNNGTLASSTIVKMSSQSGRWTELNLDKESFANQNGTITAYLHRTINTQLCNDINRFTVLEEKALEERANTISFWVNYVPENYQTEFNILDYNVTYGSESTHLFTVNQAPTTTGSLKLCDRGQSAIYGNINECIGKWTHFVITNPAYSDGSKDMQIYVNGQLLYTKTVSKPDGTLGTAKICFGGEAAPTATYVNWPTDFKFADVKVYSGVIEPEQIVDLFNAETNSFVEHGDGVSFKIFQGAVELNNLATESQASSGNITGKLTVNNPKVDGELPARLFAAVFEEASMVFVKVFDGITLMPGQVDYIEEFDLDDVFENAKEGQTVSFFVWGNELKPLTKQNNIKIRSDEYGDGTFRLVINPDSIPNVTTLKPERFTATAGSDVIEVEKTIYYPMINEIHLLLKEPPLTLVPYTVTANLTDITGNPLNINTQAVTLGYSDTPLYEDTVKYVKLAQNGNPVTKVSASGTYTIDVGAAFQGTREGTAAIKVYKKSESGTVTVLATRTVNVNENDYTFEPISVNLDAGDKVYAEFIR